MEESLGEREEICGICGHLYPWQRSDSENNEKDI